MRKLKQRLIFFLVLLILLAGAFALGFFLKKEPPPVAPPEPTVSGNVVAQEIFEISELAVLRYHYSNVARFGDSAELKGWKIPFSTKSFVLKYNGEIKLGIDASAVTVAVDETNKEIRITLPPVKILSHAIDERTIEVWDQTKNIFNPILVEDYKAIVVSQKKAVEKDGISAELKEEAAAMAKKQIGTLVRNLADVKGAYTVTFAEAVPKKILRGVHRSDNIRS